MYRNDKVILIETEINGLFDSRKQLQTIWLRWQYGWLTIGTSSIVPTVYSSQTNPIGDVVANDITNHTVFRAKLDQFIHDSFVDIKQIVLNPHDPIRYKNGIKVMNSLQTDETFWHVGFCITPTYVKKYLGCWKTWKTSYSDPMRIQQNIPSTVRDQQSAEFIVETVQCEDLCKTNAAYTVFGIGQIPDKTGSLEAQCFCGNTFGMHGRCNVNYETCKCDSVCRSQEECGSLEATSVWSMDMQYNYNTESSKMVLESSQSIEKILNQPNSGLSLSDKTYTFQHDSLTKFEKALNSENDLQNEFFNALKFPINFLDIKNKLHIRDLSFMNIFDSANAVNTSSTQPKTSDCNTILSQAQGKRGIFNSHYYTTLSDMNVGINDVKVVSVRDSHNYNSTINWWSVDVVILFNTSTIQCIEHIHMIKHEMDSSSTLQCADYTLTHVNTALLASQAYSLLRSNPAVNTKPPTQLELNTYFWYQGTVDHMF